MSGSTLVHRGGGIDSHDLPSGMTFVKFPVDVQEHVIDQFADDTLSLRNCALTCRAWHPRSRYYLVSSIQVRTRDDYDSLCEFFGQHHNLSRLVESLTVNPSSKEPHPRSLTEVALIGLLRQLPNLRRYRLVHEYIDTSALAPYQATFHPRTLIHLKTYLKAETLHLGPLKLSSFEELGRLVIALPRLRGLECRGLIFGRQTSNFQPSRFGNKTNLIHVSIQDMDLDATKFVLGLSCALRSASFEVDGSQVLPYINFSTLPELQELRLSLVNLANETEGFGEVARLLMDNLPPKLRNLTFILPFVRSSHYDIHLHRHEEYVSQDCRHLEDILSGAQLEGVTFILSNIPIGRARSWEQMLEQFFPVLHSRSLIKVECTTGQTKRGHNDHVTSLQVSTDHRWVASTSADGTIIAWSIDGKGILEDTQLPGSARPFVLPCGDCFVSSANSSPGYGIAVWDVKGRQLAQGCEMPTLSPRTVAKRHDHPLVTLSPSSTSFGGAMKIYDNARDMANKAYANHEVQDLPFSPSSVKFVVTSHDGTFLAVACNLMHRAQCFLWRKQMDRYVREDILITSDSRGSTFTSGAFSPVSFSPYQHTFSIPLRIPDSNLRSYGNCLAMGFSDGTVKVASLCVQRGRRGGFTYETEHWKPDSWMVHRDGHGLDMQQSSVYHHDGPVTSVAFSPRGTFLLSASEDSTLKVLARNSAPQRAPITLRGHRDKVHAACFSPDERYIASASEDRTVRVWRVDDWSCLTTFTEHKAPATHVVFCPTGGAVWSAARDGRVCRHTFATYVRKGEA